VKPDASKLLRALEDPMSGIVYTDDARIATVLVAKEYARDCDPGAFVTISLLDGT
jgi:Holliday junction resolvase RusA-like endonuclease